MKRSRRRRGNPWAVCVVLAALAGLVLIACGPRKDADTGPAVGSAPAVRIAGIIFQEDQFFRMVELGMKTAASAAGVDIMTGNSFGALDKEIALVDSYIAAGVKAIVLSPLSRQASGPALQRAAAQGIKIVTYNTTVDGDIAASDVESDQVHLGAATGKEAREYVDTKLGGKAKIALIEFMSQAPEQASDRVKGFKSAFEGAVAVEIVAEQDAWLVQQAADVVEQILTAHPELNLVWAANEGGTLGAVIAVRNAGKAGKAAKVVVFGTDMSEQLGEFLLADDNVLQAVTSQQPFEIGTLAVNNAVKAVEGKPVERSVSLPGVVFSRNRPQEVKAYVARLRELSKPKP